MTNSEKARERFYLGLFVPTPSVVEESTLKMYLEFLEVEETQLTPSKFFRDFGLISHTTSRGFSLPPDIFEESLIECFYRRPEDFTNLSFPLEAELSLGDLENKRKALAEETFLYFKPLWDHYYSHLTIRQETRFLFFYYTRELYHRGETAWR